MPNNRNSIAILMFGRLASNESVLWTFESESPMRWVEKVITGIGRIKRELSSGMPSRHTFFDPMKVLGLRLTTWIAMQVVNGCIMIGGDKQTAKAVFSPGTRTVVWDETSKSNSWTKTCFWPHILVLKPALQAVILGAR